MSKSEQTRQHIIEQAAPVFNKYGYAGTSVSRLTRAINMTKGAIYGNFKDKDDIALAAFDFNMEKITRKIARIIGSDTGACEKLICFANFYLDEFTAIAASGGCPVLNAAVDSDHVHPRLKACVNAAVDKWVAAVAGVVRQGIRQGQISGSIKPEQFASIFVSLIEGGMMLAKVTGNTIHLSRNIDHIIHLVNTELRI